jgi:hypothetical protein
LASAASASAPEARVEGISTGVRDS